MTKSSLIGQKMQYHDIRAQRIANVLFGPFGMDSDRYALAVGTAWGGLAPPMAGAVESLRGHLAAVTADIERTPTGADDNGTER